MESPTIRSTKGSNQISCIPTYHIWCKKLVAKICDHRCIATFANTNVTVHNKQMEPQIKVP